MIGTPPFGRNGVLARAFLRHATAFADIIVFILPASFAKTSMQRGIDRRFHLAHQTQSGAAAFETCEAIREVRTVLQIWEKRDHPRAKNACLQAAQADFEFVRDIKQADLVVRRVGLRAGAVPAIPLLTERGTLPSGCSPSSNSYLKSKGCDPATLARGCSRWILQPPPRPLSACPYPGRHWSTLMQRCTRARHWTWPSLRRPLAQAQAQAQLQIHRRAGSLRCRNGHRQVLPTFYGISVFRWDINIRESAILGLVGAGGIGAQLQASLNVLAWPQVTLIILVILATVVVSEWVSARVRHAIV